VLVLQQIQYACRDAEGKIKTGADAKSYRCDPGDVGTVEAYDQFGPGTWKDSGRYTSINGQVLPTFASARAGKIERWRMIHGGVRDSITLQIRAAKPDIQALSNLRAADNAAFIDANCTGAVVPQHVVAADGLTLGRVASRETVVFQPGYRWDSLMVFPNAGTYCVINTAAAASAVGTPSRQLLGLVQVLAGDQVSNDLTSYLRDILIAAANARMPSDVRQQVVTDLQNGLILSKFVAHETILDGEVTGRQELTFNIDVRQDPIRFQVDGRSYDPDRVDRVLTLGSVDEWTLKSAFVSHPFHIHVNPFQIVKILDPTGKDVADEGVVDDFGGAGVDPQYAGLKGVWKDTLWIKNLVANGQPGIYTIVVRTRYRRYIGDFVLHCHILDHEDQGMMQNVRIALPGAADHRH
jgi:L-ascorbate oxidase